MKEIGQDRSLSNGFWYSFDQFRIDPANRQLFHGNAEVKLPGKVYDILLVFVENPGRLLEKHELMEKVWDEEFIEESNLARNVSLLRKALGDTGKEHRYIATVQGRGYRFVGEVTKNTKSLDEIGASPSRISRSRPFIIAIGAVAAFAFAAIFLMNWFARSKPGSNPVFGNIQQTILTSDGNVHNGNISPDGQYLVYSAIGEMDSRSLCVRHIPTGSILTILPPRRDVMFWGVAVAADNSAVYYNLKEEDKARGVIYRVPLLGGQPPRKVVEDVTGGPMISPDGARIVFTRMDRQAGTESLVTVNNDGTSEMVLLSIALPSKYYSINYSPGGQAITYVVKHHEPEKDYWYIAEMPVEGGQESRIGEPSDTTINGAQWLPDRTGLIVNALDKETRLSQLYYLSYPSGTKHRITSDAEGNRGFSMSADGRTIVTNGVDSNNQIWISSGDASSPDLQITRGTKRHFNSIEWIGNDYLVFDEDEGGGYLNRNIWRMRSDGSEREQLTFGQGNNMQCAVSPDGNTMAFVSERTGRPQVWRMNADGSDPVQLTDVADSVHFPHFSRDGRYIYFGTFISGKKQVWQIPVNGGNATPLVMDEIYVWAVSSDGLRVAYSIFDPAVNRVRTLIQEVGSPEPSQILEIAPETWMVWEQDGKSIYYNTSIDGGRNMWSKPLNNTAAKEVTRFKDKQIVRCAWSKDKTKTACIRNETTYDSVMIRLSFE